MPPIRVEAACLRSAFPHIWGAYTSTCMYGVGKGKKVFLSLYYLLSEHLCILCPTGRSSGLHTPSCRPSSLSPPHPASPTTGARSVPPAPRPPNDKRQRTTWSALYDGPLLLVCLPTLLASSKLSVQGMPRGDAIRYSRLSGVLLVR